MVGHRPLEAGILVRVQVPEPVNTNNTHTKDLGALFFV